jgi:hypothetical protein
MIHHLGSGQIQEIKGIYKVGSTEVEVITKKITKIYKNRNNKEKKEVFTEDFSKNNKAIYVNF